MAIGFEVTATEMTHSVRCEWNTRLLLGEGPVWDERTQSLYFVDILGHALLIYRGERERNTALISGGLSAVTPMESSHKLLCATANGLTCFDPTTQVQTFLSPIEEDRPANRTNDGKCDAAGRFWIGTMDRSEMAFTGALYRFDSDAAAPARVLDGIGVSNGLDWSPDGTLMYYTDSMRRVIWRMSFDMASGTPGERKLFIEVPSGAGAPDGLTVDAEGFVWSAHWDGWRVTRYDPAGRIDRVIPLPVPRVTSVCFGGRDLGTLFITSASTGLAPGRLSEAPLSGALFSCQPGVKGRPASRARLGGALLGAMLATSAKAQKLITPDYLLNSDPTCRQIDDTFYLFTTQDPFTVQFKRPNTFYRGMFAYHALSTKDFDNWVDHGSILTSRDASWNTGAALWDGDAGIAANDRFYAYAPFRINSAKDENYGRYQMGVFSAPRITGPYRDVFGGPMKDFDGAPLEGLSPTVITGDDGAPYLLWGSGDTEKHEIEIARLKPNYTELAEPRRAIEAPAKDECGNLEYFESPMLFKAGAKWYLTYVAYKDDKGPRCDSKGSYVRYVMGDSMFGPFEGKPRTLIFPALGGSESTQQGICRYRASWYLAYHLPFDDVVPYDDHHRQVAITRLEIQPDQSLKPVHPEQDPGVGTPGVARLTLDAFAARREAIEFHSRHGVEGEQGLAGEYHLRMKNSGYIHFKSMDFGKGARHFRAEISTDDLQLAVANLEIRVDSVAGPRVGALKVQSTPGRTDYRVLDVKLPTPVKGVHDLFLVARGEGAGALFNLTWFAFDQN